MPDTRFDSRLPTYSPPALLTTQRRILTALSVCPRTHQELASILGMDVYRVTRNLRVMRDDRLVGYDGEAWYQLL